MTIKERLIKFIEHKGVTKYNFYKTVGLSNGFLDKEGAIYSSKCELISEAFPDLNIDWLITGRGNMSLHSKAYSISDLDNNVISEPMVPLVNFGAVAGSSSSNFSITDDDIQDNYVVPDFQNIQFMIRVQGSSMYPKYTAGDIVACRILHEPSFIQWNKVHVLATKEQGILIKRLKKGTTKDTYCCVSENKEYDSFNIPIEDCYGIALVVGVIRVE